MSLNPNTIFFFFFFRRKNSLNSDIDDMKKKLDEIQTEKKDCMSRVRELTSKKDSITDDEHSE